MIKAVILATVLMSFKIPYPQITLVPQGPFALAHGDTAKFQIGLDQPGYFELWGSTCCDNYPHIIMILRVPQQGDSLKVVWDDGMEDWWTEYRWQYESGDYSAWRSNPPVFGRPPFKVICCP